MELSQTAKEPTAEFGMGEGGVGSDLGSVIDQKWCLAHNDFEMPSSVPVAVPTRQLDG